MRSLTEEQRQTTLSGANKDNSNRNFLVQETMMKPNEANVLLKFNSKPLKKKDRI